MEKQELKQQANEANNYKSYILAYRNGKVTAGDLENWLNKIEEAKTPKEEKECLKQKVAEFVFNRLYERYIEPFLILSEINDYEALSKKIEEKYNVQQAATSDFNLRLGFSIMANMCSLMETIQSFRDGIKDSRGQEPKMFEKFIDKYGEKHFALTANEKKEFANTQKENTHSFYQNIRNGILHQGETKGGWRINNGDKAIDVENKLIDAKKFLDAMENALKVYTSKLKNGEESMEKCITKLKAIIENCK